MHSQTKFILLTQLTALIFLLVYFPYTGKMTIISKHDTMQECNLETLRYADKKPICLPSRNYPLDKAYH